ncbi:hypothetical protein RF11_12865 [Thelohanellus kitauei]|uniref:Reverse transcriptase domain-containing protein n=1 Tax=Thelohanellus kitauei TaxID=669202 RepID=A0A0C2M301_THEKT|nr:hypothetical protein RF11_12865 [Thelohanellus kitauei]
MDIWDQSFQHLEKPILMLNNLKKHAPIIKTIDILPTILNKFSKLFSTKPIIWKPRELPFTIKVKIEQELKRLLDLDIIDKVDTLHDQIKWASPIVSVKTRRFSSYLCRLQMNLQGGTLYSVIDLKDAYLQMNVSEVSRGYLTISTHLGFYSYKILPFGISSAPAIFQRYMVNLLIGLKGVACYMDDIIITGENDEENLANLEAQEIKYMGHRKDKNGIHPCSEKFVAIKNCRSPVNLKEPKTFLGTIGYYSKFNPMLHANCAELYRHETIFKSLKEKLIEDDSLIPYDPSLLIILRPDASDVETGAVLVHITKDGIEKPRIKLNKKSLRKQYIDDQKLQEVEKYPRHGWLNKCNIHDELNAFYEKRQDISIEDLHVDLAGPLDGVYWLVIVDAHLKWCEVDPLKHATSHDIVNKVGVAYDGPPFISHEFSQFLIENGDLVKNSPPKAFGLKN